MFKKEVKLDERTIIEKIEQSRKIKDERTKMEKIEQLGKDIRRYELILHWLPSIRSMIRVGGTWEQLKATCEPLGLSDTAFRDEPTIKDYLVDYKYWKERLQEAQIELKKLAWMELTK